MDKERQILEHFGDPSKYSFHFCASRAEAINSAHFSHYSQHIRQTGNNHILASSIESTPLILSLQRLEEWGCALKTITPNSQGQITQQMLKNALTPRTGLISLSWANGLTGVIHPIADLIEVCKERGIFIHVDATHMLGKSYFRIEDLDCDYFTFDAGIVTKKDAPYAPLILGADPAPMSHMDALAQVLEKSARLCDHLCLETARLRDRLEREILRNIPDAIVFFAEAERLPNCTAIGFPKISGEALLYLLHQCKVYATLGGGSEPTLSSILTACGIDSLLAESAISFNLSHETTEEDITHIVETIVASVHTLKTYSQQIELI